MGGVKDESQGGGGPHPVDEGENSVTVAVRLCRKEVEGPVVLATDEHHGGSLKVEQRQLGCTLRLQCSVIV